MKEKISVGERVKKGIFKDGRRMLDRKKKGASGVYMYAFLTGKLPWGEST